jgi:hypothetical protein
VIYRTLKLFCLKIKLLTDAAFDLKVIFQSQKSEREWAQTKGVTPQKRVTPEDA